MGEDSQGNINYTNGICKRCGQKYIDTSESRYSILCKECREDQLKYPIPKIFILLGIALFVLIIVELVQFPKTFKDYAVYKTAEDKARDGYVIKTLESLRDVIDNHSETKDIAVKAVDIAMDHGYYDYADYLIDEHLVDEEFSETVYDRLNAYIGKIDSIYNVYDKYENIESNIDPDLSVENASIQIKADLKELLSDKKYDKATVYNCLSLFSDDEEEYKDYLKKCIESDPKVLEPQVQLANAYRREGNVSEARNMLDKVVAKERNHVGANVGLAIINMLEENYSDAVKLARCAYENDEDKGYIYIYETLAIALYFDGQVEESNKIIEEFKAAGNELEEDTEKILSGQLALNEYYEE